MFDGVGVNCVYSQMFGGVRVNCVYSQMVGGVGVNCVYSQMFGGVGVIHHFNFMCCCFVVCLFFVLFFLWGLSLLCVLCPMLPVSMSKYIPSLQKKL
jgi:hypothetical protein